MASFLESAAVGGRKSSGCRRLCDCAATLLLFACERRAVPTDSAAFSPSAEATQPQPATSATEPARPLPEAGASVRELRFAWRPPRGNAEAYAMDDPEDQHWIILPRGAAQKGTYPVVVAFHGQPKRGEAPRRYAFAGKVIDATRRAVERGDVRPVVLVLPVFRYFGTNWPEFDVEAFRNEIDGRLAGLGIAASAYYVVGHSGAAGCGGDGMNRAHRMRPAAVGFFDTCLGRGWREEVQRLRTARIPTLLMHSLETAGFSPRQPIEYSPTFDFGLAYGPAGLAPTSCPPELPIATLRDQPFRCSGDERGVTLGLIVDSGEGEEGHNALVPIALEYFLKQYVGRR